VPITQKYGNWTDDTGTASGGNKPLPIGTFLAIVKQCGIDPEEFSKR
jgi:hypothetical protein